MGWASALMFTGAAFGFSSLAVVIICEKLEKGSALQSWLMWREKRAARKRRRQRVQAMHFLRSTSGRDHFNEFEGARK